MRKSDGGLAGLKRLRQQALDETGADTARRPARPPGKKRRHGAKQTAPPRPESAAPALPPGDTPAPELTIDDAVLFERAMRSVTPIRATGRVILPPRPAASRTLLRQRRQWASGSEPAPPPAVSDDFAPATADDATHFVRAGHGPDLIRDLRRGKWPMQASLDLHGSTLDQARERLDRFLVSCMTHGIRSVQVVHGKGLGSKDGTPVLKQTVRRWLTQIDTVLAYVECEEVHGGAGAVQVLLRAPEKPAQPGR